MNDDDYLNGDEEEMLTDEQRVVYMEYVSHRRDRVGCTCFQSPPCSVCTHEGHPISLREEGIAKMETKPTPHVHRDLIVQWANDPSQTVWYLTKNHMNYPKLSWVKSELNAPAWYSDMEYHIGDQPPREQVTMAGYTFDKPLEVAPEIGEVFFITTFGSDGMFFVETWENDPVDQCWLKSGVVHKSQDSAIKHSKALIALNKQACGLGGQS